MKVQILSRKFIKPSTPTPHNLQKFKISFNDELAATMNIPVILYYPANVNNSISKNVLLQKSLAQTLTKFYPLAGRYIKEEHLVDCNDQGAEYVEAKAGGQLTELLGKGIDTKLLNQLMPCEMGAADEITDALLAVQVNMFDCGGIAITVCISHRIADASTLSTFISAWATASLTGNIEAVCANFDSASFFPGKKLTGMNLGLPRAGNNLLVTKTFSFNEKMISALRAKAGSKCQASRLQLVSALVWKCLIGVNRAKNGHLRGSFAIQTVNLRDKTVPPLAKHACGNLCGLAIINCMAKLEYQELVQLMNDAIKNTISDYKNILSLGEDGHKIIIDSFKSLGEIASNSELDIYMLPSWCRFPFYEADFGWGKPIWVSNVKLPVKACVFMDGKGGDGIDVWVTLDETDMLNLENDQDIKIFTS